MTPDGAALLTTNPDQLLAESRAAIRAAEAAAERLATRPPEGADRLALWDEAMGALGDVAARASVCHNAHPDPAMQKAAETLEQEVDQVATRLQLDRRLYDALAAVDPAGLDAATRHYLDKTLRDMRRAGVDRDEATRDRVRALREELVRIGQAFGNHIKDDVRTLEVDPAALDGLPEDYRAAHPPGPDGKVRITTDNTDYVPFITYARDAAARQALWRLYRLRGHPHNLAVLGSMLEKRHELATLLGYPSWAAYVTEDKMIGSAERAASFVAEVAEAAEARMRRDYEQLLQRKRKDDPTAERVNPWDQAYYQERVAAEEYGFDSQAIRPYFEYARVKQGVLDVTAELFGLRYQRVEAKTWHPEVEVYDVLDGETRLGRIYLDMHPREGKYKHYAQFTLTTGVRGKRLPEGVLMCNFPRPGKEPALMEHDGVRTFFHEFGHLLHHVLGGQTRWAGQSGVATEWDFVEAPSQMLEEWVWDPAVLRRFARHYQTGEALPAELVEKARRADEYGKGLWVRQQMFYASLSLEYHRRDPKGLDTTALLAELQARLTAFPHVEGTYFQESFGHLDGYSALYYTYMWSLVIAKDLFSVFKQRGIMDATAARRYRDTVLARGGEKPAAELVRDFLGREYGSEAFRAWLDGAA